MNLFKLWVAAALLAGSTLALADPPSQVGRLNYVAGTVSFAPAEANTEWVAAPLNRPITTGDRLWADRDGRAEMRIGSTAIRLQALTHVDVLRLDEGGTQLRLAQGTLHVRLRRLDAGENFEISTPGGAVLLAQPGDYRINADPSGAATTVLVRRGQADVLTNNAPYSVRDNQLAVMSGQGQELFVAPAPDEFDHWAAARDRQDERVVATRYVPREMTGYEDLDQHGSWRTVEEYGAVWTPTAVAADWAPYRQGHWVWISPWEWTWVDNAPWGFAPYHYGRWIWLRNHWAWAPGARVARPVYAPALVAFVGGANWSVSVRGGPAVGWVPLGWREPYIPWYRHSPAHVRNVNVNHVTNINIINHYSNTQNGNNIRYVNRGVPSATTVVTRDTFVSARPVQGATLRVPAQALSEARVMHEAPVARPERLERPEQPERASLAASRPGPRLPDAAAARQGVATGDPVLGTENSPRIRAGAQQRTVATPQAKAAEATGATAPQAAATSDRNERAAQQREPREPREPRASVAPAQPQQAQGEAEVRRQQQQRQFQQEQQRQARAAQQQQQQQQEQLKAQQSRDQQHQQAQQVERQRQLKQQQPREQRPPERAQMQPQAVVRPPQAAAATAAVTPPPVPQPPRPPRRVVEPEQPSPKRPPRD